MAKPTLSRTPPWRPIVVIYAASRHLSRVYINIAYVNTAPCSTNVKSVEKHLEWGTILLLESSVFQEGQQLSSIISACILDLSQSMLRNKPNITYLNLSQWEKLLLLLFMPEF